MQVLGIVGGVASGKSQAADCFRARGAVVLDADRAGHEVLRQPDVQAALVARWGAQVLDAAGLVSRPAVAAIVFAPGAEAERRFLEQITHPRIAQLLRDQIAKLTAAGTAEWAILDAALLLEAGWEPLCDRVIYVDTPEELRRTRAHSRGWDAAELARREATQLPLAEKRRRAHFVLPNQGDRAALQRAVDALLAQLA